MKITEEEIKLIKEGKLGPIMLANYCIDCMEHRAMVIYEGNSLCLSCFKKELEKVKK